MLALPGGAYLYQGEELGLPEHTDMPGDVRQDPTWSAPSGTERGRDGCRVPMPWAEDAPSFGFGPTERTWLPQPATLRGVRLDQQGGVEGSTLEPTGGSALAAASGARHWRSLEWVEGRLTTSWPVVNSGQDEAGDMLVLANLGDEPVALPEGATVLRDLRPADRRGRVCPRTSRCGRARSEARPTPGRRGPGSRPTATPRAAPAYGQGGSGALCRTAALRSGSCATGS